MLCAIFELKTISDETNKNLCNQWDFFAGFPAYLDYLMPTNKHPAIQNSVIPYDQDLGIPDNESNRNSGPNIPIIKIHPFRIQTFRIQTFRITNI